MFTNIEGDIDDVLKVIRDATMKLAGQGYRTDVVIRLDIRPGFEGQIHAKQALVDENPVGINQAIKLLDRQKNRKARYL